MHLLKIKRHLCRCHIFEGKGKYTVHYVINQCVIIINKIIGNIGLRSYVGWYMKLEIEQ